MKSKRARDAAATAPVTDDKPVAASVSEEQPAKKRKRSDDDAEPSTEVKKSKKDKKDKKKDKKETRKEKKDKRKNLQDLPEQDMDVDEAEPETESKKKKDDKKEKKETKKDEQKDVIGGADDKESQKLERREKKKEKKALKQASKAANSSTSTTTNSKETSEDNSNTDLPGEDAIDLDASSAQKPGRNIVFVGNLPYSATAASISAHFVSLKPIAVRCLTKKENPKACRGIAFVEFASSQHQRTCLDKFHHSTFNDGISAERKINVELTAGGGGKNQNRQNKIMEKNKKLDENRAKRIEKENAIKEENRSNGAGQAKEAKMDIHPSRLARLPGLGQ